MKINKKHKIYIIIIVLVIITIIGMTILHAPYYYSSSLLKAINKNDIDEVKNILEKYDFDVNTPERKPNKIWDALTENSPDVPLSVAAQTGNFEIVSLLIKYGATAKYIEGIGWTPLVAACLYYHTDDYEIIKLLLENGAEVNSLENGQPAIVEASKLWPETYDAEKTPAFGGFYDENVAKDIKNIVELLLENGADIDGHGIGQDYSLLKNAADMGNIILLEYLLEEKQIDINYQDFSGQTALFGVTEYRSYYIQTVEFLLANGADKSIRDNEGRTAYDFAIERGFFELAEMIKP